MGQVTEVLKRCLSYGEETEWFEYKQGTAVSKPDDRQVRTAIDFQKPMGKYIEKDLPREANGL